MGDLGYISQAQDSLNISYNSIDQYTLDLKNALKTSYKDYKKLGEFKDDQRIQLNDSIIQIENEYYSTIRPKGVCPTGERPINVLNNEGIDYLELRCIDLNPKAFVGISEEQIYFLDLLILFCFLSDSPSITESESNELFRTHKTIVNEGRSSEASITTLKGKMSIREEAVRILDGMQEIAEFMSEEVSQGDSKWTDTLTHQKEVINSLDKSLSGSLLEEIKSKNLNLQEYGMKMSLIHKEHMDNLATDDEYFFTTTSQDSLETAKKIEESNQENFEDYLKDFLNKIS